MSTPVAGEQMFSHVIATNSRVVSHEVMVLCPACKTFETVWLNNGKLNQNRKFTQYGSHIYHDCGSNAPCRLFTTI
jgi:hypothetical protein